MPLFDPAKTKDSKKWSIHCMWSNSLTSRSSFLDGHELPRWRRRKTKSGPKQVAKGWFLLFASFSTIFFFGSWCTGFLCFAAFLLCFQVLLVVPCDLCPKCKVSGKLAHQSSSFVRKGMHRMWDAYVWAKQSIWMVCFHLSAKAKAFVFFFLCFLCMTFFGATGPLLRMAIIGCLACFKKQGINVGVLGPWCHSSNAHSFFLWLISQARGPSVWSWRWVPCNGEWHRWNSSNEQTMWQAYHLQGVLVEDIYNCLYLLCIDKDCHRLFVVGKTEVTRSRLFVCPVILVSLAFCENLVFQMVHFNAHIIWTIFTWRNMRRDSAYIRKRSRPRQCSRVPLRSPLLHLAAWSINRKWAKVWEKGWGLAKVSLRLGACISFLWVQVLSSFSSFLLPFCVRAERSAAARRLNMTELGRQVLRDSGLPMPDEARWRQLVALGHGPNAKRQAHTGIDSAYSWVFKKYDKVADHCTHMW